MSRATLAVPPESRSACLCKVQDLIREYPWFIVVFVSVAVAIVLIVFVVSLVFVIFEKRRERREQVHGFEVKLNTGVPPVAQRKDNDHG